MGKLVLHTPGGGMRDFLLDRDRLTIGRRADNDVCLQYPAVSADHAEIVTVRGDSFLHDLGSTNGTLVNGKRIVKHFLQDHDTIDIGRVQLVYLMNENEIIAPLEPEAATPVVTSDNQAPARSDAPSEAAQHMVAEPAVPVQEVKPLAPEDELLAELMESTSEAAVAVEMPPTISRVPVARTTRSEQMQRDQASAGVFVEVVNGPNAGQLAPMTKREFVLGRAGVTKAVIRRDGETFMLVPHGDVVSTVNGQRVPLQGMRLSFGDIVEVAGVRVRFSRR